MANLNVRRVALGRQGVADADSAVLTGGKRAPGNGFRPVKSAYRTLDVLEALAAGPRTFGALARFLDIPKSSLHGLVATLRERGWVEQGPDGTVLLGLQALQVGTAYLDADESVSATAGLLDQLAAATGETVQLARLDGPEVVYLAKRDSTHPVRLISAIGARLPAHATALGKALLATREPAEVRRLLRPPLPALTTSTITDVDRLSDELQKTRRRGYAVDREEATEGLCCVAIAAPGGQPALDAISVSIPTFRLSAQRRRHVVAALLGARDAWSTRCAGRPVARDRG